MPPKLHHSAVPGTNDFASLGQQVPYGYAQYEFQASHFDELSMEPNDMIMLEKKVSFSLTKCSSVSLFIKKDISYV